MLNKKTTDKFLKAVLPADSIAAITKLNAEVKIGGGQVEILHNGVVTVQADLKSNTAMAVVLGKCSQSVIQNITLKMGELLGGFTDYHHYNISDSDGSMTEGFELAGTETGHIDAPAEVSPAEDEPSSEPDDNHKVSSNYENQLSQKVELADAELLGCPVTGTNSTSIYYAVVVEKHLKIAIRISKSYMVSIRVYFKGDITELINAVHLTKSGAGTHIMSTHLNCKTQTEVVSLLGALYFVASTYYYVNTMLPVTSLLAANNIALPSASE